jgi:hypothetical protein
MAQAIGTFDHAPHDATSNVSARNDDALILIIINIHPALGDTLPVLIANLR